MDSFEIHNDPAAVPAEPHKPLCVLRRELRVVVSRVVDARLVTRVKRRAIEEPLDLGSRLALQISWFLEEATVL